MYTPESRFSFACLTFNSIPMKNIYILLLLVIVLSAKAQTEKIDSLKSIVIKTNDAQTYFELYKISSNKDSAFLFLQKALTYVKDKSMEAEIRRFYSREFLSRGYYSMAQKQSFESLKLALEVGDSTKVVSAYLVLGVIANQTHLYDKAILYYEEGLKFAKNRDQQANRLKNNYGLILMSKNDLYKATGIYQELLQKAKDSIQLSTYHNNAGTAFLKLKNYDSAYAHIKTTLNISLGINDSSRIMFNSKLMGQYYYGIKQYNKAKYYFKFSLKLNESFNEVHGLWNALELPELYQCMTDIYTEENNIDSLLWIKNLQIEFQKGLLEKQQKSSAEFVFDSHEEELSQLILKQNQGRKNMAEYYGIALAILFFLIAYFIFAGKDKQGKYSPYISLVILILSFEFILTVLDPVINKFTNNEPLYNFICNVLLAFLVVPLQHWGEKIFKKFVLDIRLRKVEEPSSP